MLAKLQNIGIALEEQRVRALTATKPEATAAAAHDEAIAALSEEQREGRAGSRRSPRRSTSRPATPSSHSVKEPRNRFLHQYRQKEVAGSSPTRCVAGTTSNRRGSRRTSPRETGAAAAGDHRGGSARAGRHLLEHLELPPSEHVRRMEHVRGEVLLMTINVAIVCSVKLFQADAASPATIGFAVARDRRASPCSTT